MSHKRSLGDIILLLRYLLLLLLLYIILYLHNNTFFLFFLLPRPALKNECRSEENYSWSAKPAITSNGEHCLKAQLHMAYDIPTTFTRFHKV
jgi:hypothetical protein